MLQPIHQGVPQSSTIIKEINTNQAINRNDDNPGELHMLFVYLDLFQTPQLRYLALQAGIAVDYALVCRQVSLCVCILSFGLVAVMTSEKHKLGNIS